MRNLPYGGLGLGVALIATLTLSGLALPPANDPMWREHHAHVRAGDAALREGRPAEALRAYDEARKLVEPFGRTVSLSDALSRIGNAQLALGDSEAAIANKRRCLEIEAEYYRERGAPHHRAINHRRVGLARALIAIGRHEQALEPLRDALREAEAGGALESLSTAYTRYVLGECLTKLGRHPEAIEQLTAAVARWSRSTSREQLAMGREALARCLLEQGWTERAHRVLIELEQQIETEEAAASGERKVRCLELLAQSFGRLGEKEMAARKLRDLEALRARLARGEDAFAERRLPAVVRRLAERFEVEIVLAPGLENRRVAKEPAGVTLDERLASLGEAEGLVARRLAERTIGVEEDWRRALRSELAKTMALSFLEPTPPRLARALSSTMPCVLDPVVAARGKRGKNERSIEALEAKSLRVEELVTIVAGASGLDWDLRWGVVFLSSPERLEALGSGADPAADLTVARWTLAQQLVSFRARSALDRTLAEMLKNAGSRLVVEEEILRELGRIETPASLSGIRLGHALALLLRPHGLDYELLADGVRITRPAK